MANHFYAYISRMRCVKRWALMRNTEEENIQEHSHMVAVLAHALGVIRRDIFHQPCDVNALATAALYHDASEILTGDLPTPIKYYNPEIKSAYKQIEAVSCEKLLALLLESLSAARFITPKWQRVAGAKGCFLSKLGKPLTAKDLSAAKQMADIIDAKREQQILDCIRALEAAQS